ncbi:MAG: hypothetical protein V1893_02120 [Candidatus Omnitrophota bacterium]
MNNSRSYGLRWFVRLIAILAVECFIVSSLAPDYAIRSLDSSFKAGSRQLKPVFGAEAPDFLVPPLLTDTSNKARAKELIKKAGEASDDSQMPAADDKTETYPIQNSQGIKKSTWPDIKDIFKRGDRYLFNLIRDRQIANALAKKLVGLVREGDKEIAKEALDMLLAMAESEIGWISKEATNIFTTQYKLPTRLLYRYDVGEIDIAVFERLIEMSAKIASLKLGINIEVFVYGSSKYLATGNLGNINDIDMLLRFEGDEMNKLDFFGGKVYNTFLAALSTVLGTFEGCHISSDDKIKPKLVLAEEKVTPIERLLDINAGSYHDAIIGFLKLDLEDPLSRLKTYIAAEYWIGDDVNTYIRMRNRFLSIRSDEENRAFLNDPERLEREAKIKEQLARPTDEMKECVKRRLARKTRDFLKEQVLKPFESVTVPEAQPVTPARGSPATADLDIEAVCRNILNFEGKVPAALKTDKVIVLKYAFYRALKLIAQSEDWLANIPLVVYMAKKIIEQTKPDELFRRDLMQFVHLASRYDLATGQPQLKEDLKSKIGNYIHMTKQWLLIEDMLMESGHKAETIRHVRKYFGHLDWELKDLDTEELFRESAMRSTDREKVDRYAALTTEASPIIVITRGTKHRIIDGLHRLKAAKERGDATIRAYVAVYKEPADVSSTPTLEARLTEINNEYYVEYFLDSRHVGSIKVEKLAKRIYIVMFSIRDEFRGKGYGTFIIDDVIKKFPGYEVGIAIDDLNFKDKDTVQIYMHWEEQGKITIWGKTYVQTQPLAPAGDRLGTILAEHEKITDSANERFAEILSKKENLRTADLLQFFEEITPLGRIDEASPAYPISDKGDMRTRREHIGIMAKACDRLAANDPSYFLANPEVGASAESLGRVSEVVGSLSEKEKEILLISASLHDYGHLVDTNHYEPGMMLAKDLLRKLGYDEFGIEVVGALIKAHADLWNIHQGKMASDELQHFVSALAEELAAKGLLRDDKEIFKKRFLGMLAAISIADIYASGDRTKFLTDATIDTML